MSVFDWIMRVLLTEPLEPPTTSATDPDGALDEIREHIDALRKDSTMMERRLVALERQRQLNQGWISSPPDEKDSPA